MDYKLFFYLMFIMWFLKQYVNKRNPAPFQVYEYADTYHIVTVYTYLSIVKSTQQLCSSK